MRVVPDSSAPTIAASDTYLYGALYDFKEVGIYKLGAGPFTGTPFATIPAAYPNRIALGP